MDSGRSLSDVKPDVRTDTLNLRRLLQHRLTDPEDTAQLAVLPFYSENEMPIVPALLTKPRPISHEGAAGHFLDSEVAYPRVSSTGHAEKPDEALLYIAKSQRLTLAPAVGGGSSMADWYTNAFAVADEEDGAAKLKEPLPGCILVRLEAYALEVATAEGWYRDPAKKRAGKRAQEKAAIVFDDSSDKEPEEEKAQQCRAIMDKVKANVTAAVAKFKKPAPKRVRGATSKAAQSGAPSTSRRAPTQRAAASGRARGRGQTASSASRAREL